MCHSSRFAYSARSVKGKFRCGESGSGTADLQLRHAAPCAVPELDILVQAELLSDSQLFSAQVGRVSLFAPGLIATPDDLTRRRAHVVRQLD